MTYITAPFARSAAQRRVQVPAIALTMSVGVVLAVMAALYVFAWPIADDFQRAVETRNYGVLGAAWHEYATWTCRWSAALIMAVLSDLTDVTHLYGLSVALIGLASFALLHSYLSTLLNLPARSTKAVAVTAVFVAAWWASAPEVAELFFWRAGETEYQLGFAAAIAVIATVARLDCGARRPSLCVIILLEIAAFMATGLHELAALMQAGFVAAIVIYARIQTGRWQRTGRIVLIATLIGILILMLAPGNTMRDQAYAADRHLMAQLAAALFETAISLARWIADPRLIAGSALMIALIRAGWLKPDWPLRAAPWLRWMLPVLALGAVTALYTLPYLALAGGIPRRTLSAVHLVFLCGWLATLLAWSPAIVARLDARRWRRSAGFNVALVALALAMPLSTNFVGAVLDLAGPARAYDAAMTARDVTLRHVAAEGFGTVAIPAATAAGYPHSYVFNADIRADRDFWINRAVAAYYGLDGIIGR